MPHSQLLWRAAHGPKAYCDCCLFPVSYSLGDRTFAELCQMSAHTTAAGGSVVGVGFPFGQLHTPHGQLPCRDVQRMTQFLL
jgi:hypothetical protein